jgi:BlaI family transcriptional regulator, penicillinase repressor
MKKTSHLTPGEFELMEILWPIGEASVKSVWEKVDPARGLAYTTVMTVLEKMYRKGILAQRKKGKAYLYSPILSREEALKGILEHVCSVYFQGSHEEMSRFIERQYPATAPKTTTSDLRPPTSDPTPE